MNKCFFFPLLLLLLSNVAFAADIASEIRMGSEGPETGDGGFLEIGVVGGFLDSPEVFEDRKSFGGLTVAGAYRYKGLFFEWVNETNDGLNFGYNLWNNDTWSVDLLAFSLASKSDANADGLTDSSLSNAQRVAWLDDRTGDLSGSGVRLTRYFGDYIFQYRLLTNTHHDRGVYSTARLGRSWQYRNWNFHGIVSARYVSADHAQQLFGVTANEATPGFPEYYPGSSLSFTGELGATYPISEHWVFRTTLRFAPLSSKAKKSPLMDGSSATVLRTSLSYVF